jgi:uncharacterized integral membrane protein
MRDIAPESASRGVPVRLIAGGVGVAVFVLFLLQNLQDAEINFLWFDWNIPVVFALLASAVFGAIAALAFTTLRARRRAART